MTSKALRDGIIK